MNVVLPFEEALKPSVAIQACLTWLNEKNRATKEGNEAGLNLAVNFARRRVFVMRGMKVTKAVKIPAG